MCLKLFHQKLFNCAGKLFFEWNFFMSFLLPAWGKKIYIHCFELECAVWKILSSVRWLGEICFESLFTFAELLLSTISSVLTDENDFFMPLWNYISDGEQEFSYGKVCEDKNHLTRERESEFPWEFFSHFRSGSKFYWSTWCCVDDIYIENYLSKSLKETQIKKCRCCLKLKVEFCLRFCLSNHK